MIDKTPKIFNYIRLMQDIPCIGRVVDGCVALDCNININDKACYDVSDSFSEKIRFGKIELEADERTKARIEKMIRELVPKVDEPLYPDFTDMSYCGSCEEAIAELKERNKQIIAYRNYVEVCNSIRLLYNLLTPEIKEYLDKRRIIAGTGYSVGGFDKLTDYYQEVADCKNLIKKGCEKIIISVCYGTISNIQLIGRNGKDTPNIPLLDKNTNVRCRVNPHENNVCLISDIPLPKQNISLQLLNLYIDPKDAWENVNKMSFHYEPDSDYLYTFAEVRDNIMSYLQAVSEHEIREKNQFTQIMCQRMECLYRYLRNEVKLNKSDTWDYIRGLYGLNGDDVLFRYLGLYQKELPIQFTIGR